MTEHSLPYLNASLDQLRDSDSGPAPVDGAHLAPGIFFLRDEEAEMKAEWSSPRGRILDLKTEVARPGRWFGLHVGLPLLDLSDTAYLGFVMRSSALRPVTFGACLRSGLAEGGFVDTFFDRQVLSRIEETDHIAMLPPPRRPQLPAKAEWREFVLFLPTQQGVDWSLIDLRFFAL